MKIKRFVYLALAFALIWVCSAFIYIPTSFGFLNISDAVIMILTTIFSSTLFSLVAGIALCFVDIFLGYSQYAIFTLIIKMLEALVIINILKVTKYKIIAYSIGILVMLIGYGLTDVILFKNFSFMWVSIVANMPQAVVALIVGIIISPVIERVAHKFKIKEVINESK